MAQYNESDYAKRRFSMSGWMYVLGFAIPLVGFIVGIIRMAQSEVGPGIAIWATSFIGWIVWTAVLVGAGA